MHRNKQQDIALIHEFVGNLSDFKRLKEERWEKIDEDVQKANRPGVPSEDWIPPPDEDQTRAELSKDVDYVRLKSRLEKALPELKAIARFVHFNTHHDFDWVIFTTPLIGNDAVEDGLNMARRLFKMCKNKNYLWAAFINTILGFFSQSKI